MNWHNRWLRISFVLCALLGAAFSPAPDAFPQDLTNFETSMVADLNKEGESYPDYLTLRERNSNSQIYFSAKKPGVGTELWRMGPDEKIRLVEDINPDASSSPTDLVLFNNNFLFFSAIDEQKGDELWRWNLDPGVAPVLVSDINPNGSASPRGMTEYNGKIYFSADDDVHGKELWKVGSSGAPVLVADINTHQTDNNPATPDTESSSPDGFTPAFGTLYFAANNYWNGTELFKLNGSGNPVLAANINTSGSTDPQYMTLFRGELYFSGYTSAKGVELYKINSSGIWELVADINPDEAHSFPRYLTVAGDSMYFSADDGEFGFELWRVTSAGEVELVQDINIFGNAFPNALTIINDTLYFSANNGEYGQELWRLRRDGTAEMIEDINIFGHSFPSDMTYMNGVLYFSANDGVNGREMWKLDKSRPPCKLPDTGLFPENELNPPLELLDAYMQEETDIVLAIPALNVQSRIVQVPLKNCEWDLAWLGGWIGYLEGTTFPTYNGNCALTAHNRLYNDEPGPFSRLYDLVYNDQIYIYAWGMKYTYGVTKKEIVVPQNLSVLEPGTRDEITLISCKDYDSKSAEYLMRVVVKAVLARIDYADVSEIQLNYSNEEMYFEEEYPEEEFLEGEYPDEGGEVPEGENP